MAPISNIDRENIVAMGILLVIDDGVYVCIYIVYSCVFKEYAQHAFVYDSHFSTLDNSECCGAIIGKRSYAPICVLDGKYTKIKSALNNMLNKLFDGNCIVEYYFKVTANDYS